MDGICKKIVLVAVLLSITGITMTWDWPWASKSNTQSPPAHVSEELSKAKKEFHTNDRRFFWFTAATVVSNFLSPVFLFNNKGEYNPAYASLILGLFASSVYFCKQGRESRSKLKQIEERENPAPAEHHNS